VVLIFCIFPCLNIVHSELTDACLFVAIEISCLCPFFLFLPFHHQSASAVVWWTCSVLLAGEKCVWQREKLNRNDVSVVFRDQLNMIFTEVLPVYGTVSYPTHFLHLCLWIFNAWPLIKTLWSALVCCVWILMPAEEFTEGLLPSRRHY